MLPPPRPHSLSAFLSPSPLASPPSLHHYRHPPPHTPTHPRRPFSPLPLAAEPPRPSISSDGKAQKASFYKRPSKAIEMGGGFFIPGLEGYKLRLFTSVLVCVLLALNRYPGYEPSSSQLTSEVIGVGAAIILLAQALIEKVITDAGSSPSSARDEDNENISLNTDPINTNTPTKQPSSGLQEACFNLPSPQVEDDVRWAGYALEENLGSPSVCLLHAEKGLLYRRSRTSSSSNTDTDTDTNTHTHITTNLLKVLPPTSRRAVGMGDALAPFAGVNGEIGTKLAHTLTLTQAEGVVVVRVGEKGMLAVAPPRGGIKREQAVWVERVGALLEAAGLGK